MDLTRPVTYRGLTLTGAVGGAGGNAPIEGFRLTRGRFSEASVHGYVEKKSLDDGMDASDVFLGMRSIALTGELFAARKAALFDALDLLRLKFTPTDAYNESPEQFGYLPLAFSQPTLHTSHWPLGFIDRVVYARPSQPPGYDVQFDALHGERLDGDTGGFVVPFDLRLEAKDPRFYNPVLTQNYLSPAGTSTSGSGTLLNRGNYPAPLDMLLMIPASQTAVSHFHFAGVSTTLDVTIPAGTFDRVVRIDSRQKVCTLTTNGVETLRMDLPVFSADSTWPKVPPTAEGDTAVGYNWTCDHALANVSRLFFQEAWV